MDSAMDVRRHTFTGKASFMKQVLNTRKSMQLRKATASVESQEFNFNEESDEAPKATCFIN